MNGYREGSVEHEIVRALQAVNKLLSGDSAIKQGGPDSQRTWKVVQITRPS